jgi:hypothetical protein
LNPALELIGWLLISQRVLSTQKEGFAYPGTDHFQPLNPDLYAQRKDARDAHRLHSAPFVLVKVGIIFSSSK